MKKIFKLMSAALMALAMFVPAQAAELTVYDGSTYGVSYNEYVPIYGYYYDTNNFATQIIYPATQIEAMQGSSITSLKFYVGNEDGNALNGGVVGISVGVTELSQFPGYSPALIENLTEVAEITMTPGETEVVVNFNEPFSYEGGNLVIEATVKEASGYASMYFLGEEVEYNASMYRLPASGSAYAQAFGPKTTFNYEVVEDFATISTSAIDFGTAYPEFPVAPQTFVLKNMGQNAFTPVFSALTAPFSVTPAPAEMASGSSMEFTVNFTPTELGQYAQTLAIDCGAAGQFEIALTGAMSEVPDVITVCDGTATNGYLPFYGYYYDNTTKGQMIYTAEMLAPLAGKKITEVTFYPTAPLTFTGGQLQLSFKVVDQQGFTSYTALTDLTAVATWEPGDSENELVFTLDEPFEYDGGNLAIEVFNVVKGTNWPRAYFYGENMTDYYPSYYQYGASTDIDHFLPKVGFGYEAGDTPEPQGLRGDVNLNNDVTIADVTALIYYLLSGDATGISLENANCNLQDDVTIADVTALIDYLLSGNWPE